MDGNNIILKRADFNDIELLTDLKRSAFKEEFLRYGFTPEDMISREWHRDMLERSIYYKIIKSGEIVGGVNIFGNDSGEYYLCSLFIDKERQNRGLGTEVVRSLECLHRDWKKWSLDTPGKSKQNHHFYEKVGYKHVDDMIPKGAPDGFSLRLYEKRR